MSEDKSEAEKQGEKVSGDVKTVIEHLKGNKTTRTEAVDIKKAAERSITEHDAVRGFNRL